jgi:hypothetical protein
MRIGVGLWPMAHRHCLALLTDSSMKRIWLCEEWLSEAIRIARAHGALNQVRPRQQGDVAVGGRPSAHPLNPAGGAEPLATDRAVGFSTLLRSQRPHSFIRPRPAWKPRGQLTVNRPIASRTEATGWVVWASRRYSGGSPS